jgi:hypothetical protein
MCNKYSEGESHTLITTVSNGTTTYRCSICNYSDNVVEISNVSDFKFTISDATNKTATLSGFSDSCTKQYASRYSVVIPSTYTVDNVTYTVTAIGAKAFYGCTRLVGVSIPNTITKLGDSCFNNCISLTSVKLPDSVTTIGAMAFYYCYNLSSINIPDGVTTIYANTFVCTTALNNITLSKNLKTLYLSAFHCSNITTLNIPASLTNIVIGWAQLRNLYDFTVDSGNTKYTAYDGALYSKDLTTLIKVGKLKDSIKFPSQLTTITSSAFQSSSIKNLTIPASVTSIAGDAFIEHGIKNVNVASGSKSFQVIDGVLYDMEGTKAYLTGQENEITTLKIPDGVTYIANYAFAGNTYIKEVKLPTSLITISRNAFYQCYNLESINLENVTTFGASALMYTNINNITLSSELTNISDTLFSGCKSLKSINIPSKVTTISSGAFEYCSSLTSVYIPSSVTSIGSNAFHACSSLTSITIPEGVTTISDGAFYQDYKLSSLSIPESVTAIGWSALRETSSLTTIKVDSDNKNYKVVDGALYSYDGTVLFAVPYNVTTFDIPKGVTTIRTYAFMRCKYLTSVTIPSSVTRIEDYAFWCCYNLTNVYIPSSVTYLGAGALGYTGITSITIPDSVTVLNSSVLEGCKALTSVSLPSTLKTIVNGAFAYCTSLTSITIPSSVKVMGRNVFTGCTALKEITYAGTSSAWSQIMTCSLPEWTTVKFKG